MEKGGKGMNPKDLAISLIASSNQAPQDLETLKQEVSDSIKKFAQPRQDLIKELVEDEEKFYDTVAHIIDAKWDSGILDPIDYIAIKAVVKGALKKLDIYSKIK